MAYRDQTPLTTPERVRNEAQRNERDQRVLDSPEHHRAPYNVRVAQSGVSAPPIPPSIFMPTTAVPSHAPIYNNLPSHLAQQYAALPDLYTNRQASAAPQLAPAFVPAPAPPQLAPAFVPAPAPAQYRNLPANLAERLAALPPLVEHGRSRGRGRGRGRGNITTAPAPAPAPLPYAELAARYAALPPVGFYLICEFNLKIKLIFVNYI